MPTPPATRRRRPTERSVGLARASGALWPSTLVTLAACASAVGEPVGSTAQPIIGGVASTGSQNFVVELVRPAGMGAYVCSGSLVAPNLVLTARHCVTSVPSEGFSCDETGEGTDGGALGADYEPSSIFVYAGLDAPSELTEPASFGARIFHDDATNLCNHDLALLSLTTPIEGVAVAPLALGSVPSQGELLTAVGWGVNQAGMNPAVRQQRTGVDVLAVGPSSDSSGDEVASSEMEVGESICAGDSGGPALTSSGAVVGVASRGGNGVADAPASDPQATCVGSAAVNVYTEVAPFHDLILSAFSAAGATPTLVDTPLGDSCETSRQCASGLCATVGDAGLTCTQDCARSACPGGFVCDELGANALCVAAPSGGCALAPRPGELPSSGAVFGALPFVSLALLRLRRRFGL